MKLLNCIKKIQYAYRKDTQSTEQETIDLMRHIKNFDLLLEQENSVEMLERCALKDLEWSLHVDGKLKLLAKAKRMGAVSPLFLLEFYAYRASVTSPSPERDEDVKNMNEIMEKYPNLKDAHRDSWAQWIANIYQVSIQRYVLQYKFVRWLIRLMR